jgi:membrane protease YdiL (CAAX protease family)
MQSSQIDEDRLRDALMNTAEHNGSAEAQRVEPSRKIQAVEVTVFLLLIVPSLTLSFFVGERMDLRFIDIAISSILNDVALLCLVLYFIWRNQEPVERVGWNFAHLGGDVGLALILFVPVYMGGNAIANVLHEIGLSAPARRPSFLAVGGLKQLVLALTIVTVVAVVEETVFRGYLMLRFEAVSGSRSAAVISSSFMFALGHGYEGMAGAISVFVLGVVFALLYLWRRSLVAPIVIHFLIDFASIVLPALLQGS